MKILLATALLLPNLIFNPVLAADKKKAPKKAPSQEQEQGEVVCGPVDGMLGQAAKHYGEYPRFMGKSGEARAMLLMTLNEKTGTWTLFTVRPDGDGCVVGTGDRGKLVKGKDEGEPS